MAPDYVVQFADGVYMGSDGAFTGAAFSGARSEVLIVARMAGTAATTAGASGLSKYVQVAKVSPEDPVAQLGRASLRSAERRLALFTTAEKRAPDVVVEAVQVSPISPDWTMEQRLRRSLRGSARMRRIAGYWHAATGAVHGRRTS